MWESKMRASILFASALFLSVPSDAAPIERERPLYNVEIKDAAGVSVIGVSLDSIERLNDFSADPEYCAGALAVASDASGAIAESYDLEVHEGSDGFKDTRGVDIDHGFAERTTFIVTSDGKIAETIGGVSPMENVHKSLEAVKRLH